MKLFLSVLALIFFISVGTFAQEKSCCSSGDHSKKEVSIEKSINKDGKTVEVKETVMKDGKTVEVKKVLNEEIKKDGCCSSDKEMTGKTSDKNKDCSSKDLSSNKSDCCKSDLKAESKTEVEKKDK
ncbi:Hypothetical protein IALB_2050 [Ignavibacterium album JCM 16511]|uniref:Uncharacterized protein n=1 Tax=Ignavibacterium album (strain DSM 19864 / JCM 16511 / NBRC 101810 / Mat9-16) TaxID=945713 RepID=I0AL98_IGNAJ|nr:hypothetical protein [Ignavibacterium album]AFH49755.1 Hypothetical protein IALB_2050 [Ignavibacterium album JCM 16511]